MIGKTSLALRMPPFVKSFNYASERWIDEDRLSKFDGMCA